jgi:Xaa-Pro dipeptidase
MMSKAARHAALAEAQQKALAIFRAAQERNLIRPGILESQLNDAIHNLAGEFLGQTRYWHKRIVRSGPNTLAPYREDPPDRVLTDDDIVFFDFGPVLEAWEADIGRTYVLGNDPDKHRIATDVETCWALGKQFFDDHPTVTGAELYQFVCDLAAERGWQYGQEHCGHLIGQFPHERIQGESRRNYIHPDNHESLRAADLQGRPRDWILEVHFVDRRKQIGGFFEQVMTDGSG